MRSCALTRREFDLVIGTFHRYTALLDRLDSVPMNELVMAIRRTSPGFTRGSSSFRGVTQHKSSAHPLSICPGTNGISDDRTGKRDLIQHSFVEVMCI